MLKKIGIFFSLCVLLILVVIPFISCRQSTPGTATYIVGSVSTAASSNNPFSVRIGQSDATHMNLLYEALVIGRNNGETDPWLAQSWSYDEDSMTYTVKINPKAKFNNGEKVTASDVKFTVDKMLEIKQGAINEILPVVADTNPITAVDDTTVAFELKTFLATFIRKLANVPIVPESIWGEMTNEELLAYPNEHPVGSGPFILRELVPDSHIIYDRAPNYWGGPWGRKPVMSVYINKLYSNSESQLADLKAGNIDAASNFQLKAMIPQLLGDPNITVKQVANNSVMTVVGNHRHEPWNLAAFRQAVSIGLDRANLISYATNGWGKIPTMLQRDPDMPDVNPDLIWPYDGYTHQQRIDMANDALDAIAGMSQTPSPIPPGWVRTYNGNPVSFNMMVGNTFPEHVFVGEILVDDFAEMGININLQAIATTQMITITARQKSEATMADWQMYVWGRAWPPEYDYFAMQWGYYPVINFTNFSCIYGWRTATAQAIGEDLNLIRALPEGDPERDALIASTQLAWAEELPILPLYSSIKPILYRNNKFTGWVADEGMTAYGAIEVNETIYNLMSLELL